MNVPWESSTLQGVPHDAATLAVALARPFAARPTAVREVFKLHLEALDAALAMGAPELLADQLRWQTVRLPGIGITAGPAVIREAIVTTLRTWLDDDSCDLVERVHNDAAVLGASSALADGTVRLDDPRARAYLAAALTHRREEALAVIREALREGADAADVMLEVLQPAQVELGRLWEQGLITVAHEHYTTAVTQVALSLLYPQLLAKRSTTTLGLVATGVGSETHEVGIRMISDLMENAGWRTAYLGADVADRDVVDRVAEHRADVLAISATMARHISGVRRLISALRADPRCAHVRVLVGGRPFSINPELAAAVGADGWAPDARGALGLCQEWATSILAAPDSPPARSHRP